MTKLLVISDIHGAVGRLRRVLEQESDYDYLIFLGDGKREIEQVSQMIPQRKLYAVRGNCDYDGNSPLEGLVPFEGLLFFFTHGHAYRVKYDLDYYTQVVQNRGADVGLFGHTHAPTLLHQDDPSLPTLFNPGSLGYGGHYGVITCHQAQAWFTHKKISGVSR